MARSLGCIFETKFESGKELSTQAEYLTAEIAIHKDDELGVYYYFCLVKLLESYHEWLSKKFGVSREILNKKLEAFEDFKFECEINSEKKTLVSKTTKEFEFDDDALASKGFTLSSGELVKNKTDYARYLIEKDLPVPNYLVVEDKAFICRLNKKAAASAAEAADEFIKEKITRKFNY